MPKQMTPRERYLCALNRGQPDRLPATTLGWHYHSLPESLRGKTELEVYRHLGLEAYVGGIHHAPSKSPQWREEVGEQVSGQITRREITVTTPGGPLHYILEINPYTAWLVHHPIEELEQIRLIDRYWPASRFDREYARQVRHEVGEDGVVGAEPSGWRQPGPWQDACEWAGTQRMIMETFDHPDWVHEFMEILTRKRLETIETMAEAPFDVVLTGGGAASSTVISPRLHEEYCLPYDRRIHEVLHSLGFKCSYHTCGGMMPILELIASNGCDCMEPFAPPGMGGDVNLAEAKRRIGGLVCMKGGFDQGNVLQRGTPEQVYQAVLQAFGDAGTGGGFILCPSDQCFDVPIKNLQAYAAGARACLY